MVVGVDVELETMQAHDHGPVRVLWAAAENRLVELDRSPAVSGRFGDVVGRLDVLVARGGLRERPGRLSSPFGPV